DLRAHAMLIRTPFREPREVLEHLFRVRVENVRAILMDQNAGIIHPVIRIASDMRSAVYQEHAFARAGSKTLRQNRARITCSHDRHVEGLTPGGRSNRR